MSAIPRRILFALLAMLACALLSIIVIGGATVVVLMLSLGFVIAPIAILLAGPGPLGDRINFRRRRKDDHIIDG